MAICAVALGITIIITGMAGQAFHHLNALTSPSPGDVTALDSNLHTQAFVEAEAAPMPMLVFAYAGPNLARDGDATGGPSVVKINREYLGDHCEYCMKIEYNPYLAGKAGIAMKTSTPLDVQTPQRLVLWARGEYGGEQVRFMLLGKQNSTISSNQDANLFDNVEFVSKTKMVTLTTNFKVYQIDVPDVDPARFNDITHLSAIEIDDGNGLRPVIVYVKGFVYDTNQPDPKFKIENEEIATAS